MMAKHQSELHTGLNFVKAIKIELREKERNSQEKDNEKEAVGRSEEQKKQEELSKQRLHGRG